MGTAALPGGRGDRAGGPTGRPVGRLVGRAGTQAAGRRGRESIPGRQTGGRTEPVASGPGRQASRRPSGRASM